MADVPAVQPLDDVAGFVPYQRQRVRQQATVRVVLHMYRSLLPGDAVMACPNDKLEGGGSLMDV